MQYATYLEMHRDENELDAALVLGVYNNTSNRVSTATPATATITAAATT